VRPFGDIVYLTPALNMDDEDLAFLCRAIYSALSDDAGLGP
jgi:adenosylmethionine-8-amino-7-oxononanoate aminotransferase